MSKAFTMQAEGYDELAAILLDAFKQASEGKGAERHANDLPFDSQPMQTISDIFDSDKGMAFQVVKKLREGLDMPEYDRLERELLGSIVYTAGIILWHKRRSAAKKEPKPTFTIQTTAGGTPPPPAPMPMPMPVLQAAPRCTCNSTVPGEHDRSCALRVKPACNWGAPAIPGSPHT